MFLALLAAAATVTTSQTIAHPCALPDPPLGYGPYGAETRLRDHEPIASCSDNALWDGTATSFLRPSGKAPAGTPMSSDGSAWCMQYASPRLKDGDTATAWCEGAEGDGEHEIVVARIEPSLPIEIAVGFGKSAKAFAANGRPRKVRVTVLRGCHYSNGDCWNALTPVASHEVELKDVASFQPLPLPKGTWSEEPCKGGSPETPEEWVMIEILSVRRGTKYRDTCISELRQEDIPR